MTLHPNSIMRDRKDGQIYLALPSRGVTAVKGCEETLVAIATVDEFPSENVAFRRDDLRNSGAAVGEDTIGTDANDSVDSCDPGGNGCIKKTSNGGKGERCRKARNLDYSSISAMWGSVVCSGDRARRQSQGLVALEQPIEFERHRRSIR